MNPRWIGLIVFMAIIMAILGSVSQGQDFAYAFAGGEIVDPDINTLVVYTEAWQNFDWGVLIMPSTHTAYFSALFRTLVGQNNLKAVFPDGTPWLWIWWIMWNPVTVTVMFGILMLFIAIIQRAIS